MTIALFSDILCKPACALPGNYDFGIGRSSDEWHAINIGSVGKPKAGNSKGCYVMLTIDDSSSDKTGEGLKIH